MALRHLGIVTSIGVPGVTGGLGSGAIQVVGIPLGAAGLDPLALLIGAVAFTLLTTWARGRKLMMERMREAALMRALGASRRQLANAQTVELMLIGGLAGLAGAIEVLGVTHRYEPGFEGTIGFDGITIALLWHGLQSDPYVMKDRASRLWFESTTKLLFEQRYADHA